VSSSVEVELDGAPILEPPAEPAETLDSPENQGEDSDVKDPAINRFSNTAPSRSSRRKKQGRQKVSSGKRKGPASRELERNSEASKPAAVQLSRIHAIQAASNTSRGFVSCLSSLPEPERRELLAAATKYWKGRGLGGDRELNLADLDDSPSMVDSEYDVVQCNFLLESMEPSSIADEVIRLATYLIDPREGVALFAFSKEQDRDQWERRLRLLFGEIEFAKARKFIGILARKPKQLF
jgi:hypothetical protein